MKMKRVLPVIVLFAVLAGTVLTCALCGVFSIKSEAAEVPTFDTRYTGEAGSTQVIDGVTYTFVTDAATLKTNLANGTNCILGGNITLTAAQTPLVLKDGVALYGNQYALEVNGTMSGAMFTANGKATVTNLLVGKTAAVKTDIGLFDTDSGTDLTLKKTAAYFNEHTATNGVAEPVAGGYFGLLNGKVTMEDCYANGRVGNKNIGWNSEAENIGLGGFVGFVNKNATLSMTRCYNNAVLIANDPAVAGLIGASRNATITIDSCANQADTFSDDSILKTARDQANLISRIYGGTVTVKNCINTTNIVDRGGRQGGFIGQIAANTTVSFENCINRGNVTAKAAKWGFGDYAGGFVGMCYENVDLSFTDCRNEGHVVLHGISITTTQEATATGGVAGGDDHAVGGFVGRASYANGEIPHLTFTNCVNTGTVADYTCLNEVAAEIAKKTNEGKGTPTVTIYVGGFVGYARTSNQVTFDNCQNKGTVDGTGYAKTDVGTDVLIASGKTATTPANLDIVKNVGGFIGHTWTSCKLVFQNGTYNEGTVKGYSHLGGLVGAPDSSITITDSGNKGAVIGVHSEIGGIAGVFSSASVTCTNATNTGDVTGGKTVGGFAGSPEEEKPGAHVGKEVTLKGFVNTGTVTGTTQVGGILGAVDDDYVKLVLDACENRGNIKTTAANGTAGGLVGENTAAQGTVTWTVDSVPKTLETSFTVQNCLNTGAVTVTTSGYPGGIIGKVGAGVTVKDTTNKGTVTGFYAAGGFFAIVDNAGAAQKVQITNSSNAGKVTAKNTADTTYAGGLIGRAFGSINLDICDSVNSGEVSATQGKASTQACAGGLVGIVYSGGTEDHTGTVLLHGSVNLGKITTTQIDIKTNSGAGGIVGGMDHGNTNVKNQISHCRNYGTVSSNMRHVGGILGGAFWASDVTVTQCTNYGSLKTDTMRVGGMVGMVSWSSETVSATVNMTYCTNLGDIQSVDGNAAGMVGEFSGAGKIEHCLSAGKITVTATAGGNAVGGIVGWSGSFNYTIADCVSIANIKLSADKRAGGIIGGTQVKSITNCYSFGVIEGVANAEEYGYLIGKSGASTSNTYSGNYYLTGVIQAENAQTIGTPTAMSITEAMSFLKTYCQGFTDFGVDGGLQFINENDTAIRVATPFLRGAQQKTEADGTKTVRLLATVDSLQYQRIGFAVTLEDGTASPSTKHIYAQQYANAASFTAAALFGDYLYVLDMQDVPATGTATFTVKPYAVWNGQTVYGQAYKLTYRDGALVSFEAVW